MKTFLKACRWGQYLLIRGDMISDYADRYGEWCESEVELAKKLLPKNGVVVEVGSNIGVHSIPLSHFCSEGTIFCFEPQRVIFQVLCANAALNNRVNIHARQCAVGDREQLIDIQSGDYDQPWNYGAFSLTAGFSAEAQYPANVHTESISMISLDADPALRQIERLDLVKIDAEGFESSVLNGSRELISRFKPFLLIENNRESAFDSLLKVVCDFGYRCYWFCSSRFRSDNYNRAAPVFEGFDINMLCVPYGKSAPIELVPVTGYRDLKENRIPLY